MAYTLATTRTRLNQRLDDTAFDTTLADQFINDAQRYILNTRRFNFMEAEATVTTTDGSQSLTGVPSDLQTPLSLRIYTPTGNASLLPYIEYEDIDLGFPNVQAVGEGSPSAWYVFDGTIYIYPTADATYTLKLKYIKKVIELTTDAQVPEVPEDFSELLVLSAYKRALEWNDNFDKAQIIQLQVDELMSNMDERYKRQAGGPHIMRQPNRNRRIWGL
jgi:hypothetical protein